MFFTAATAPLNAPLHRSVHRHLYASAGRSLERFLNDTLHHNQPAARYTQDASSYTLTLDLPGIEKEQLSIAIEGSTVRLQSKEGAARSYRAAYEFPLELNPSESQATLHNGVLTLKLGKQIPAQQAVELVIQ